MPLSKKVNLCFKFSLKFSLPSSLNPKCLPAFTYPTSTLFKYKWAWLGECNILEKRLLGYPLLGLGWKPFSIVRHIWEFFLSHCSVYLPSLNDLIYLKAKRYHQQIVWPGYLKSWKKSICTISLLKNN